MSISTEVARLQTGRNKIRAKLTALGLAQSTDKLDTLATAIEGITDNGAVSANVQEGETYTIPKGYHNGSGTVSGVAGGGNYTLQSKTVKPTKNQLNVTPDSGYYGLSDVTVEAIPENYQDVSSVTATEDDVLTGKIFVGPDGMAKAGTMANNGAASKKLTAADTTYTIPKGYHSGQGAVSIDPEAKSATPTKAIPDPTLGPAEAGRIVQASPWPTVAIGGIDEARLPEVIRAGAINFSVVRAVCRDPAPYDAIRRLQDLWHALRAEPRP